jgi:O-succinylbenzoate synthase
VRIESVTLTVVRLPLVRPFETSFGVMRAREFVLIAVRDGGVTGWGACAADTDPSYSSETTTRAWHVPELLRAGSHRPVAVASAQIARVAARAWTSMAKGALEMAPGILRA